MTDCYCEENVYQHLARTNRNGFAVFISNEGKSVVLRQQKAAEKRPQEERDEHYTVIWDYHVVAVELSGDEFVVVDRDSRLGSPFPLHDYFQQTFPHNVTPEFKSRFRVIPASTFLANFASDRSHMMIDSPYIPLNGTPRTADTIQYHAPPPTYPPIVGAEAHRRGETNNLFSKFLDMSLGDAALSRGEEEGMYGVVLDSVEELCNHITQSQYFPIRAKSMIRYKSL